MVVSRVERLAIAHYCVLLAGVRAVAGPVWGTSRIHSAVILLLWIADVQLAALHRCVEALDDFRLEHLAPLRLLSNPCLCSAVSTSGGNLRRTSRVYCP